MSDRTASTIGKILRWKKTVGAGLLTVITAAGGWGWGQWKGQVEKTEANAAAIAAATQQATLDRAVTTEKITAVFNEVHEVKTDIRDVRNALMIPRPSTASAITQSPGVQ